MTDEKMLEHKKYYESQREKAKIEVARKAIFQGYDKEIMLNRRFEPNPETNGYTNDRGKFNTTYRMLWNKLVSSEGQANTKYGELLRKTSKGYYRLYNDGDVVQVSEIVTINGQDLSNEIKKNMKYPQNYGYLRRVQITHEHEGAPHTQKYYKAVEDFTDGVILTTYDAYRNDKNPSRQITGEW
jgi:hypothetical protein